MNRLLPHALAAAVALWAPVALAVETRAALPAKLDARPGSPGFATKLEELLRRTDSSIQLVRNQIASSSNAPFLADLYQQLGELLLDKANAIYFVTAEKAKGPSTEPNRQVVANQKEAIAIFDRILESFPRYEKTPATLFFLAATLRAADERPRFIETVNRMIKEHPLAVETFRARLLIGQELFDRKIYDEALKFLQPVISCPHDFEKNLAKFRSAQILIAMDKPAPALKLLEEVAESPTLDQPVVDATSRAMMTDSGSDNLRREALLETTRIYPLLFGDNPRPVEYYLRLSPSEGIFQETLEKLAFRYIGLKKFAIAGALFRTLSDRISDPERVLNIYHEVLATLKPKERQEIPPRELEHVLELFNRWTASYAVSPALSNQAYDFFEVQTRDLGTRDHEAGTAETDPARKAKLLAQARDFYLLYLRFFGSTAYSGRIAANLADLYFTQGDFFHSGETYYRIYMGEFGGEPGQKAEMIKKAIFSLERPGANDFYSQMRGRGLLIRSLEAYLKGDRKAGADPKLNFLLAKTVFEQGLYPYALPRLYAFIKRFPRSPQARDAVELVLDYHNTINDMKGLSAASAKLLAMHLPDAELNQRIKTVQTSARLKRVEQGMQATRRYGSSTDSKQYLQAALASGDAGLMDAALKEALSLSKSERDIDTFFRSANLLVTKDPDPKRKRELMSSIAGEYVKLTRFSAASRTLAQIAGAPGEDGTKAYAERIRIALYLRDLQSLAAASADPRWGALDPGLKTRVQALATDLLLSGTAPPAALLTPLIRNQPTDDTLQALYRSRAFLPADAKRELAAGIKDRCAREASSSVCRWGKLDAADALLARYVAGLASAPPVPESLEPKAKEFVDVEQPLRALDSSGDPYFDSLLAIKSYYLYAKFAEFLERIGQKNPALQAPLKEKAAESLGTAGKFRQSCQNIAVSASLPRRQAELCLASANVRTDAYFERPARPRSVAPTSDPSGKSVIELQKTLFGGEDTSGTLLALAKEYYRTGEFAHAAATASHGLSTNADSAEALKVVLGCSLVKLGLLGEARFQLTSSTAADPQKAACLAEAAQ